MKALASRVAWPALGIASVVAVWYLVVAFTRGDAAGSGMPYPDAVARAIPTLLGDPDFQRGALDTVTAWLVTLVAASVVGVLLGFAISSIQMLRAPAALVVDTLRSVPATALIPVAILIFGLGFTMKFAVAFYAIVWPILINTIYGVASTEPMRRDAARSMRWGWIRTHMFVVLPSALPSILTGVRIASGICLIVVVSTEFLGSPSGVGSVLSQYSQALRPDVMYAGILILGVAAVVLYTGLMRLERVIVKWA